MLKQPPLFYNIQKKKLQAAVNPHQLFKSIHSQFQNIKKKKKIPLVLVNVNPIFTRITPDTIKIKKIK